jgi:hypothetical protein
MVTKLVRCPHCKKLTFIRFENSKIVTCKKVIDDNKHPYYKRYISIYPANVDKNLFEKGCGARFLISHKGEKINHICES